MELISNCCISQAQRTERQADSDGVTQAEPAEGHTPSELGPHLGVTNKSAGVDELSWAEVLTPPEQLGGPHMSYGPYDIYIRLAGLIL